MKVLNLVRLPSGCLSLGADPAWISHAAFKHFSGGHSIFDTMAEMEFVETASLHGWQVVIEGDPEGDPQPVVAEAATADMKHLLLDIRRMMKEMPASMDSRIVNGQLFESGTLVLIPWLKEYCASVIERIDEFNKSHP